MVLRNEAAFDWDAKRSLCICKEIEAATDPMYIIDFTGPVLCLPLHFGDARDNLGGGLPAHMF